MKFKVGDWLFRTDKKLDNIKYKITSVDSVNKKYEYTAYINGKHVTTVKAWDSILVEKSFAKLTKLHEVLQ